MIQSKATYYNGQSSKSQSGRVTVTLQQIIFESDQNEKFIYARNEVKPHEKLGNSIRVLDCNDGARIEIEPTDAIDKLLYPPSMGVVHFLEQNIMAVSLSFVGIIAFMIWSYVWGVPLVADAIVPQLPKSISIRMGEQTVESLKDYRFIKMTSLPFERRTQLKEYLESMKNPNSKFPVKFDFTGANMPNAFALPGGQIFITDKLVEALPTDEHIRAVAWHEIGHIHHEHSMKIITKSAALTVLFFAITGGGADVSTLPLILMNQSYSRDAEAQADQFAAENMLKEGLDPALLAEALEVIQNYSDKKLKARKIQKNDHWKMPDIFSSHPLTEDRAEFLRSFKSKN